MNDVEDAEYMASLQGKRVALYYTGVKRIIRVGILRGHGVRCERTGQRFGVLHGDVIVPLEALDA